MIFSKSKGQLSGLTFIDISAAFNKINHSHLLKTFSSVSLIFLPFTGHSIYILADFSSSPQSLDFFFPIIFTQTLDFFFPVIFTQTLDFFPVIFTLLVLTSTCHQYTGWLSNLHFHVRFFSELHAHISNCLLNSFILMSNRHLKCNMTKTKLY